MPRPFTTDERNLVKAAHVTHVLRCEAMDLDETFIDVADVIPGVNPLVGATVSVTVDGRAYSASIRIIRGTGNESASPLIEESEFNRDSSDEYFPRLNIGTRVRLFSYTLAPSDDPSEDTVKLLFDGRIDDPDFTSDVITLTCRDLGGKLLYTTVTEDRTYGDVDTPVEADDVAQQFLTDNADIIGESITLSVPEAPTYSVTKFQQVLVSVMDALNTLAMLFGWVVRYEFDETTDAFALTLFDPQRDKTTPDYTLEATEYLRVDRARLDSTNLRNHVIVWYVDGVTGESAKQEVEDAGSIAAFGRRTIQLGGEQLGAITTGNDALALAEYALSDLSTPLFDHQVTSTYTWFARIGDLVGFTQNGVHYDADQALALVAITHEFPDGGAAEATTSFQCRGKPAGAYERWLRLQGGPVIPLGPPLPEFAEPMGESHTYGRTDLDGTLILRYGFKAGVDEIRVHSTRGSGPELPVPDISATSYAFTIRRPEGDIGKNPNYSSIAVISTLENYYKRLTGVGVRNGLTSPQWNSGVVQALDPSPAITRGTLASLVVTKDVDAGTNTVTVTPATLDSSAESFVVVVRNEHELTPIPIGTSLSAVEFEDSGLDLTNPQKAWTYDAFILSTREDDGVLHGVTGQRFRTSVENPTVAAPEFTENTPVLANVGGTNKVQISWVASTPTGTEVLVEASLDRVTVRAVGTGPLASGTVYDSNTGVKSYRLVARSAIGVRLAASEWRLYTTQQGPLSNPLAVPQFTDDTPKRYIAIVNGFPRIRLVIRWACATPGVKVIQIQRSTDNGVSDPWTEVARDADTREGEWVSPTADYVSEDAYYRLRALGTVDDPALAMSTVVHYVP